MTSINKENHPPHDSDCTRDGIIGCLVTEIKSSSSIDDIERMNTCCNQSADLAATNLKEEMEVSPASPTLSASEMYDELFLSTGLDGDLMEEEEVDTASTAKRRRRKKRSSYSRKKRKQQEKPIEIVEVEEVEVEMEDGCDEDGVYQGEEDPTKIYCYCRTTYDCTKFYIACDGCQEWYHGECVDVDEELADEVELWYCKECVNTLGRCAVFKVRCAASLAASAALAEAKQKEQAYLDSRKPTEGLQHVPSGSDLICGGSPPPNSESENAVVPPSVVTTDNAMDFGMRENLDVDRPQSHQIETSASMASSEPIPEFSPTYVQPKTCKKYIPAIPAKVGTSSVTGGKPISGGPNTRFCSDECGLSMAQHSLQQAITSQRVPRKGLRNFYDPVDGVDKNYGGKYPKAMWEAMELRAKEEKDVMELLGLVYEEESMRRRIEHLKVRLQRIERAVERAEAIRAARIEASFNVNNEDLENCNSRRGSVSEGWICGFDSRILTEWIVPAGVLWLETESPELYEKEGDDELLTKENDATSCLADTTNVVEDAGILSTMCKALDSCSEHEDWECLRVEEAETELKTQVEELYDVHHMQQLVTERIRQRRRLVKLMSDRF